MKIKGSQIAQVNRLVPPMIRPRLHYSCSDLSVRLFCRDLERKIQWAETHCTCKNENDGKETENYSDSSRNLVSEIQCCNNHSEKYADDAIDGSNVLFQDIFPQDEVN